GGKGRGEAEAGTRPEWQIGAIRGPRRNLASEPLGHERGRLLPKLAMAMHDQRADPDLRTRFDRLTHNLVVGHRLSHEMRNGWIEAKRLTPRHAHPRPTCKILKRAQTLGRKRRDLSWEPLLLIRVEGQQIRCPEQQACSSLEAAEDKGRALVADFRGGECLPRLGTTRGEQQIEQVSAQAVVTRSAPLRDDLIDSSKPRLLKGASLARGKRKG